VAVVAVHSAHIIGHGGKYQNFDIFGIYLLVFVIFVGIQNTDVGVGILKYLILVRYFGVRSHD